MRKSEKLGLSQTYDRSNGNIRDDALILLVLEKHRFEDVARVCAHYGVRKVKESAGGIKDSQVAMLLQRMLKNIEQGFADATQKEKGRRSKNAVPA